VDNLLTEVGVNGQTEANIEEQTLKGWCERSLWSTTQRIRPNTVI